MLKKFDFQILIKNLKLFLSHRQNVAFLLCVAALLTYALCLPNQMFWDDEDFILKNTFIKDWHFWPNFFTENLIAGNHLISNYWRPLLQILFATEWHLWADWVYGWHATSIIFHAAAGVILFYLIDTLMTSRTLAVMTALLWLVHPVHTEAVVYPNSMGDSLATFIVLAGVYSYARFRLCGSSAIKSPAWWTALFCYPLALMSKETGILLVAFIALADFFFLTPDGTFVRKTRRVLAALWPFIIMAVIYIILRATVLNFRNSFNFYNEATPFTSHFDIRLATFFRVISLYAGFIFTPHELRVERLIDPPQTFLESDVLWGMTLCAILIGLVVRNWKKHPAIAFGILWFFVGILPTCNLFVIINAMVYEHFIYMALPGIILIVLYAGQRWSVDERKRRIFLLLVAAAVLAGMIRSAWRCTDWRTSIKFYEQLLPHVPTSYRVINNLGMAYAENGFPHKAEETYKKAIALDPSNAVSYHNLANIYRDRGESDLAQANYEKAIALQENFIFSYKSLAQIYLNKNAYNKARLLLEKYYMLCDEKEYVLGLLAEIAFREGAYSEAQNYLQVKLQINPHDQAALEALKMLDKISTKK